VREADRPLGGSAWRKRGTPRLQKGMRGGDWFEKIFQEKKRLAGISTAESVDPRGKAPTRAGNPRVAYRTEEGRRLDTRSGRNLLYYVLHEKTDGAIRPRERPSGYFAYPKEVPDGGRSPKDNKPKEKPPP